MTITTFTKPEVKFRKENQYANDYQMFFVDIANIKLGYRQCYSKNPEIEPELTMDAKFALRKQFDEWAERTIQTEEKLFGTTKHFTASALFNAMAEKLGDHDIWIYLARCAWIKKFLNKGHESPFEHGVMTYKIDNMSRAASHQFVRCRLSSYNQASQRYIAEDTENLQFILPETIQNNPEAKTIVNEYLNIIPAAIEKLKSLGIKNEDIRAIYPNATPTSLVVTMNYRELKHLIELRTSKGAQAEIKYIVRCIWMYLTYHMPFIWDGVCNTED